MAKLTIADQGKSAMMVNWSKNELGGSDSKIYQLVGLKMEGRHHLGHLCGPPLSGD